MEKLHCVECDYDGIDKELIGLACGHFVCDDCYGRYEQACSECDGTASWCNFAIEEE